jgi:hypothetical protein
MSLVEAVRSSHIAGLEALRDKLAVDMELAEPSVVAQIAGRLQAVMTELEAVRKATPDEGSGLDELARRRAARQSKPERRATPSRQRR